MNFELPPLEVPTLPSFVLSWIGSLPILLIIFCVFTFFYLIISGVLFYHWSKYGMRHGGILAARAIFSIISLVFFGFAITALSYL